jgi:hypothetical protein
MLKMIQHQQLLISTMLEAFLDPTPEPDKKIEPSVEEKEKTKPSTS